METGGFRIRLDLSQFFSDIKKFSCIYVDLSRDRQIADVVDRISELFGIERPMFLLDERFYLPESENVNVLRDSNVVKILKAFHFEGEESCSTNGYFTNSAKGVKYLRHEIHPKQVSIKNNKITIPENFGSHDVYQNEKVDSSSVPDTDKEVFHEHGGKKRKREEFVKSECTNNVEILQQDLEPETHYQKKCKRKKERVKKEVLNGGSAESLEDELEDVNSDGIHFDNKSNRKKKRNKSGQINGSIVEDKDVSGVLNLSSHENISDYNDEATCDTGSIKKHKKKRKEVSSPLDTYKILDSETVHSTDLKKRKKKHRQNDTETDMVLDQSLSLSCEKTNTTFLTSCSQGDQKSKNESTLMYQNIDGLANSGIEKHDSKEYSDSDFAHKNVCSTPIFMGECKTGEVEDFLLQDIAKIHDATLRNHLDNAISTKRKRKRVRVRKHRRSSGIRNDSVAALPPVVPRPAALQSSTQPRKHIRFEEKLDENFKENASHREVPLNNERDVRNNSTEETYDSKPSQNLNDESTHEMIPETKFTDSPMKNNFEHSIPENFISKNNTASSPNQIPLHQQWALNTANLSVDSKESLQKLLVLGKQNSIPIVFERKSQSNASGSASESLTAVSKQNKNNNLSAEGTCSFQDTTEVLDLTDKTCLTMNPNAIDPLRYPRLEGKPKKNDIIAFKTLKMTSNYTPEVSSFIIATVQSICEDTLEMSLQIEAGESDLEAPKGKFSLENEDSEKNDNDSKLRQLNWNELMDVRILFP